MHTIFGGMHYAAFDLIINPTPTSLTPWTVVTKRGREEWWPEEGDDGEDYEIKEG